MSLFSVYNEIILTKVKKVVIYKYTWGKGRVKIRNLNFPFFLQYLSRLLFCAYTLINKNNLTIISTIYAVFALSPLLSTTWTKKFPKVILFNKFEPTKNTRLRSIRCHTALEWFPLRPSSRRPIKQTARKYSSAFRLWISKKSTLSPT
jgi:hypothetical protein